MHPYQETDDPEPTMTVIKTGRLVGDGTSRFVAAGRDVRLIIQGMRPDEALVALAGGPLKLVKLR